MSQQSLLTNFNFEDEKVTENDHFKIIEKYLTEKGPVSHQFESYEHMITTLLPKIVSECSSIKHDTATTKYKVVFGQLYIEKASIVGENNIVRKIYPDEARRRDINYESTVSVDIFEEFWELDEKTGEFIKINTLEHQKKVLMKIPTMVGSSRCNLYGLSTKERIELGECENCPGGHFIINGKERALVAQERANHNIIHCFENTDEKYPFTAEIRSISEETAHSVQIIAKITRERKGIVFSLPYMSKDVSAGAVFKALGFGSVDIVKFIAPETSDEFRLTDRLIRESITYTNREKAIQYISNAAIQRVEDDASRKYTYAKQVVENELFPHMGIASPAEKAILLGKMINKLFKVCLGASHSGTPEEHALKKTLPFDDRDNICVKRIEGPGLLIADLLRMCFTGDTLVSLCNGTSKKIKDLNDSNNLLSYNQTTHVLENDEQIDFIDQGVKKLVKLTFQDGRTMTCTPDHRILVIINEVPEWTEVQNIQCNSKVVFGPDFPEDIVGNDENNWKLEGDNNVVWKLDTPYERKKTLALARILGFVMADGHIHDGKRDMGTVCLGTLYDYECFSYDFELLIGNKPKYFKRYRNIDGMNRGHIFQVNLGAQLVRYIQKFMTKGNKTKQPIKLPDFILSENCPLSVIREFLGGLFGGDGHCPRLDLRANKRGSLCGVGFTWSVIEEHLQSLVDVMHYLQNLLKRFDIDSRIYGPYNSKTCSPSYKLMTEATSKFGQRIGFRYCIHKAYKLSMASCYWRMQENIKRQFKHVLNRTNELYDQGNLTLSGALEISRTELKAKEYVMNEHYSLLSPTILQRRRTTGNHGSTDLFTLSSTYVLDVATLFTELGCLEFFTGNYVNDKDDIGLPCIMMKLMDKRDCGEDNVFDISVKKNQSFLAGGCVVHNCLKRHIDGLKKYIEKRQDIITAISRTNNSITSALNHCMCFSAGTLVTLTNGLSCPIEKLEKCESSVFGWNGKGLVPSKQTHFFNQGVKDVVRLTMEDGRTLVCTPDHKMLVQSISGGENEWVEASKAIGRFVIVGPDCPADINAGDEHGWTLGNWNMQDNRDKILAFSRLVGYVITDGHLCTIKSNGGGAYLGCKIDVDQFINDYKLVTNSTPKIFDVHSKERGNCYSIHLRTELTHLMTSFGGIIIGKKISQPCSLPEYILDDSCPLSVVREFLGGLFGGDGHCPRLDSRTGIRSNISGVAFSWSAKDEHLDELKNVCIQIIGLLKKVGVPGGFLNGPYMKRSSKTYRIHIPSGTTFQEKVGFRYCIHKSYKLAIVSSYWRMIEEIKRQHKFVVDRTNELKDIGGRSVTISDCLEIARNELKSKEYVLNEYYSLSSHTDVAKRRGTNRPKELQCLESCHGVLDAKEFIKKMGVLEWFEGQYVGSRESTECPVYTLKLMDIRPHGEAVVYDITVDETHSFLAGGLVTSNCTGSWSVQKNAYVRVGVSQLMSRLTYPATLSHLRRIVIPTAKDGKNIKIRQIHPTQTFFIDLICSPEGKSIGIVKNLAITGNLSTGFNAVVVREAVENCTDIVDPDKYIEQFDQSIPWHCIYVNGTLVGITKIPQSIVQQLQSLKQSGQFNDQVSIQRDNECRDIRIYCDTGRLTRPLLVVGDNNKLLLTKKHLSMSWMELLEEGIVRYADCYEVENSLIAMTPDELSASGRKYDYCEIHPSAMLGVCSAIIPYGSHNQNPRLVYESSMFKQALGMYALSYRSRFDTIAHVLHYPQKPLVDTKYNKMLHYDEMLTGMNPIVAVTTYGGHNMEDSVIINRSSVDRGMFVHTCYKTIMCEENKKTNCSFEKIEIPPKKIQSNGSDYSKLGENGIVRKGVPVYKGDIVIGKTLTKIQKDEDEEKTDCSLAISLGEEGIVDGILEELNSDGYKMVKIRIRQLRIPEVGDKLASRSSQKGVIGEMLQQCDMPFTADGITPDLLMNPHAHPSRMTISHLLETLAGKIGSLEGKFHDATTFSESDVNPLRQMENELQKYGFQRYGNETLYNGYTGEMMQADIYIGPTYYQRLKHLVADKVHSRSTGNVTMMHRQPLEGRSRDGGLRVGEMERDSLLAHGVSNVLSETFMKTSDSYSIYVCELCGNVISLPDECRICKKRDTVARVEIPFCANLLFQELQAMNIHIALKIK